MRFYIGTVVFFLLTWEIFSILPPRYRLPSPLSSSGPHFLSGIIHVHSRYSDGGGTVAEIADAAQKSGADFIVLTDHNTSAARRNGEEKRYGNLDLFVEVEESTPAGHLLTFYSQSTAKHLSDPEMNALSWKYFLGEKPSPGMFVAVAHPSNIKNPWTRLDRFPEGIEIVNLDSLWQRELSDSTLGFAATALIYPFNNYLSALRFFQIYRKDLLAWDAMNGVTQGHFGILAHDTHAKLQLNKKHSLSWPGYLQTFRLGSNVVFYDPPLNSEFEERKKQIYQSIQQGRLAVTFQIIHPFAGNDWRLECEGKAIRSGEKIKAGNNCEFIAEHPPDLPYPVTFQLWKDGELRQIIEHAPNVTKIPISGPGVYRLETWVHPHTIFHVLLDDDVPYVLYNPIYVE